MTLVASTVIHMTPVTWVVAVICIAVSIAAWRGLPRSWRGDHPWFARKTAPGWFPWGSALWRGWRRVALIAPFALTALTLSLVAGGLISAHSGVAWFPRVCAYLFAFSAFVLIPAVILLARPKLVIPPVLRDEPGAIADWRAEWHRRRHGGARPTV
jgi:hypothetical protein